MSKIMRLGVFCGSSKGSKPEFTDAAKQLAKTLCANKIGLVYGGANVGLMGELANAMLEQDGDVIGVIPQFLVDKELAHEDIAELHIVDTMQERKKRMADLSDGFILLPGSVGSLDEFFEMVTWTQLDIQRKPCGLLNVENYYDSLLAFLDHAVEQKFLRTIHRDLIMVETFAEELIRKMIHCEVPVFGKWEREAVTA